MPRQASAEDVMRMLLALRQAGVRDQRVLAAMESVPRALFVDDPFADRAHEDTALPIACGQTISQPSVVARMTERLDVTDRCKVLEVGAGTGYQTAVLARLARRVYGIERHRALVQAARARLQALDIANVSLRTGDGTRGWPEQAPFDRILVAAAADDVPGILVDQLRLGGVMVLPVGLSDDVQTLIRVERTATGLDYQEFGDVLFVPLVEGLPEDGG
ncbi:MAG: protein-L-isoaspartate(D-aspartate) O-methyltransferase [Pseudomonadota bacterium]